MGRIPDAYGIVAPPGRPPAIGRDPRRRPRDRPVIALMDRHPHPACLPDGDLLAQVDVEAFRASGPGGQHRNKVLTAARLVHRGTGLRAAASERRSFVQNRAVALLRLRRLLAAGVRAPLCLDGYAPSALFRRRTRGATFAVNVEHPDAPALVAEALDVLAAAGDDPEIAARAADVSTSRFVKLLKLQPDVLRAANARWKSAGRPTYR